MNKLFSKIATLSVGLAMAVGVGVALGQRGVKPVYAAETTYTNRVYTFSSPISDSENQMPDGSVTCNGTAGSYYKMSSGYYDKFLSSTLFVHCHRSYSMSELN